VPPYPDLNQVALSVALIAMIGLSAVAFIVVRRHFKEHLNQFLLDFAGIPMFRPDSGSSQQ